jgi:hypothetical protein
MRNEPRLGEILVQAGVIDEFQLSAALEEHRRCGHRLGITLVRLGFLEEVDLVRALAAQLQLPIVRLDGKRVASEVLALVPQSVAEKHNVLPLFLKDPGAGRELYLGMEDPCDRLAIEDVARHAETAVQPVIVAASEIAVAIDRLYRDAAAGAGAPADGDRGVELEDITETIAPPPELGPAGPTRINPGEADTRVILQALTQLLIEAGVVDREVLIARITELEARRR